MAVLGLRPRRLRRSTSGNTDSRIAQPRQYTPIPRARSHKPPHPSHTFNSTRKSFIVVSRRTSPRRASVIFSGRIGPTQVYEAGHGSQSGSMSGSTAAWQPVCWSSPQLVLGNASRVLLPFRKLFNPASKRLPGASGQISPLESWAVIAPQENSVNVFFSACPTRRISSVYSSFGVHCQTSKSRFRLIFAYNRDSFPGALQTRRISPSSCIAAATTPSDFLSAYPTPVPGLALPSGLWNFRHSPPRAAPKTSPSIC